MDKYDSDVASVVDEDIQLKEPPMYCCILLNDDYTPMDFVVNILMEVFDKSEHEAQQIMMSVHKNGSGVCGIYTYEIAETKMKQTEMIAEKNGFPLTCVIEEDK